MFYIINWLLFGLLVGYLAKKIYPGEDPSGYLITISIGLAGSFFGSVITFFVFRDFNFHPAGLIMSVVGAVVFCALLRWYNIKNAK